MKFRFHADDVLAEIAPDGIPEGKMNPLAVAVADCWALQALISVLSAIRSMSCWEMGANCMAKSVSSALNSRGFPRSVKDAPTVSRRFVAAAWVALNTEKLIVTKIVISVKSRNRVRLFPFFACHRERPVSEHSKKDTSYQCDGGILAL